MENTVTNFKPTKARVKKVCELYGLSESYVRHALMDRTLTPFKVGKATFVDLLEIENLISRGRVKK
ncbi:MAG: hypothetical protein BWY38_03056 [Ignavibacteria bacterium ADurb.Bin266]|nr:MAG: hypothetical protein BWY38_03056 [Ignavibacteria bacterium ADurb.Bin266]